MASYYINEAVFDLPERPFADKTIHGLEAKVRGNKTLGVLIHRRPIEGDETVDELVAENVALNEKRLSAYTVIERVSATVGGLPGVLLRTRWRQLGAMFYQVQAHVVFERQYLILASSGPLEEQAACDETFGSILETITWRSAS